MTAWLVTEIFQFIVTLVVLVGGGYLIITGRATGEVQGTIETLCVAVVSFWLGLKAAGSKMPAPSEQPAPGKIPPSDVAVHDA